MAPATEASHFSYGTLSVRQSGGRTVVHVEQAYRWNFYGTLIGKSLENASSVGVGSLKINNNGASQTSVSLNMKPKSKYVEETKSGDFWFYTSIDVPYTGTGTTIKAYFTLCCRISGIAECSRDRNAKHELWHNTSITNRSVLLTGFPREYTYVNRPLNYTLPYLHPLDRVVKFGLTPTSKTDLRRSAPCGASLSPCSTNNNTCKQNTSYCTGSCPSQLTLETATGKATWKPTKFESTTLAYAISISAFDVVDEKNTYTMIDFLFLVIKDCASGASNCAPFWISEEDATTYRNSWSGLTESRSSFVNTVEFVTTVTKVHTWWAFDPDGTIVEFQHSPVEHIKLTNSTGTKFAPLHLTWAPDIDSMSQVICLKALDNKHLPTVGTTCATLNVRRPDYILISGILRHFPSSASGITLSTSTASGEYVQKTLNPATRKPQLISGNATNKPSDTNFSRWFSDETSTHFTPSLHTMALIQYENEFKFEGKRRIFQLQAEPFLPVTRSTTNPHRWTYEVHTVFDYFNTAYPNAVNEKYTFGIKGGDYWVYMNNQLLTFGSSYTTFHKVSFTSAIINERINNPLMVPTEGERTFPVDIFVVSRTSQPPDFRVELSDPSACSAVNLLQYNTQLLANSTIFNINNFSQSKSLLHHSNVAPTIYSNNTIALITSTQSATSTSLWYKGTSDNYRAPIMSGFQTEFTFRSSGDTAEGFAFVLQDESPTARGSEGSGLGYHGMRRSLAIEFDVRPDNVFDSGINHQHIGLHTRYSESNSAYENAVNYPVGSPPVYDLPYIPFTFNNGTAHKVRIEFTPGEFQSYIYVWVNQNIRPVYSAQLSTAKLSEMFPNGAHVGFTSSASDSGGAVSIESWKLIIIPPVAEYSGPLTTLPEPDQFISIAGEELTIDLVLRDLCDNRLPLSGHSSNWSVELVSEFDTKKPVANRQIFKPQVRELSPLETNGVYGIYRVRQPLTRAGRWFAHISYREGGSTTFTQVQNGAEWRALVNAGWPVPDQSVYTYTQLPAVIDYDFDGLICATFTADARLYKSYTYVNANVTSFNTMLGQDVTSERTLGCLTSGQGLSLTNMNTQVLGHITGAGTNTAGQATAFFATRVGNNVALTSSRADFDNPSSPTTADIRRDNIEDIVFKKIFGKQDSYVAYVEMRTRAPAITESGPLAYFVNQPYALEVPSGGSSQFHIIASDAYGNLCSQYSSEFLYKFSPAFENYVEPSCAFDELPFLFCTFETDRSGVYALSVTLDSNAVSTNGRLIVNAGIASHLTSTHSSFASTIVGQNGSGRLHLFDADSNQVLSQDLNAPELTAFTLINNERSDVRITLTSAQIAEAWVISPPHYGLTFTSTIAGVYNVYAEINGQEMVNTKDLAVVIAAGDAHPLSWFGEVTTAGIVEKPRTNVQAGTIIRYYFQARDEYRNNRSSGNDGGRLFTLDVNQASAVDQTAVTYLTNGIYYIDVTYKTVGQITLTPQLAGENIQIFTSQNGYDVVTANGPFQVTVTPGDISPLSQVVSSSFPTTSDGYTQRAIAGVPITFHIELLDIYSNKVIPSNNQEVLDAISLYGETQGTSGTYAVINSYTLGTCNENICDVSFTPTISGYYHVDVIHTDTQLSIVNGENLDLYVKNGDSHAATILSTLDLSALATIGVGEENGLAFTFKDYDQFGNLREFNLPETTFTLTLTDPRPEYSADAQVAKVTCVSGTRTENTTILSNGSYTCTIHIEPAPGEESRFSLGTQLTIALDKGTTSIYRDGIIIANPNALVAAITRIRAKDGSFNYSIDPIAGPNLSQYLPASTDIIFEMQLYEDENYLNLLEDPSSTFSHVSIYGITNNFPFVSSTIRNDGVYELSFSLQTALDDLSQFEIRSGSVVAQINKNNGPYQIQVVAGALNPAASSIVFPSETPTTLTIVAGTALVMNIIPYDRNRNLIKPIAGYIPQMISDPPTLQLISAALPSGVTAQCTHISPTEEGISPSILQCTANSDGSVTRLRTIGSFSLSATVSSDLSTILNGRSFLLNVIPDAISYITSSFSLQFTRDLDFSTAFTPQAKENTSIYARFRDQFGNSISCANALPLIHPPVLRQYDSRVPTPTYTLSTGETGWKATSNVNICEIAVQFQETTFEGHYLYFAPTADTAGPADSRAIIRVRSGFPTAVDDTNGQPKHGNGLYNIDDDSAVGIAESRSIDLDFRYILRLFDSNLVGYNFHLSPGIDLSSITAEMTTEESGGQLRNILVTITRPVGNTNPHEFEIYVPAYSFATTGDYKLTITVRRSAFMTADDDTQVVIGRYTFTTLAGYPVADSTTFNPFTMYFSSKTERFTFALHDRNFNRIVDDYRSSLRLFIGQGIVYCDDGHGQPDDIDLAPAEHFTISDDIQFNSATGEYTFDITFGPAGTYTLFLNIAASDEYTGSDMSCLRLLSMTFLVKPGDPDPAQSYYYIRTLRSLPSGTHTLSHGSAGETYQVYTQLLDKYGSTVEIPTQVLPFDDGAATLATTTITNDYITSPFSIYAEESTSYVPTIDKDTFEVNDQSMSGAPGLWITQFIPIKSETDPFEFGLWICPTGGNADDCPTALARITGMIPDSNNTPSPSKVIIDHGAPASIIVEGINYNTPGGDDSNNTYYTAGKPIDFRITALDKYGNIVTTTNLHEIEVSIARTGTSFAGTPPIDITGYVFDADTEMDDQGVTHVSFTPSYEGKYEIRIALRSKQNGSLLSSELLSSDSVPVVLHANCAAIDLSRDPTLSPGEVNRYRCASDDKCVRSYDECEDPQDSIVCAQGTTLCNENDTECKPIDECTSLWYKCDDGSLVVDSAFCPRQPADITCPLNTELCAKDFTQCHESQADCNIGLWHKCDDGSFVIDPSNCPRQDITCPSGTVVCANDFTQCRPSQADCPSPVACSPGYVVCPNNINCARNLAECPLPPSPVETGCTDHLCNDGSCVKEAYECPTSKTCPPEQVFCLTDNSCRASAMECPTPTIPPQSCYDLGLVQCWTGECQVSHAQCPSRITCPVGYVLCQDNTCVRSFALCKDIPQPENPFEPDATTIACPITQFRCADGTCVETPTLCPSKITCRGDTPVMCSDGSCRENLSLCTRPSTCEQITCPNGSCVSASNLCPSSKSCPAEAPVLCSNLQCVDDVALCDESYKCTAPLPYSCPDGTCRSNISDCPSLVSCAHNTPVKCPDNSCALVLEMCSTIQPDTFDCPTDQFKCPTGECASSPLTCPTHVTCPDGTVKCPDGRCSRPGTCEPTISCRDQGQVTCPTPTAGVTCANSLESCPQGVTCPPSSPVKCFDATCAINRDACPSYPDTSPPSIRIPCPDGSWTIDTCPTPVTCPPSLPYKCSDQTCRKTIAECAVLRPCDSESDTPYRCSNGSCAAVPWDCQPPYFKVCSDPAYPIRCPLIDGESECVDDVAKCDELIKDYEDKKNDPQNDQTYTSPCAAGMVHCRDGTCKESTSACGAYTCPLSYPYLCRDGGCARNQNECNHENGCPWYAPTRCPGSGICVGRIAECTTSCSTGIACPDGSCSTTGSCTRQANGCTFGEVRCADGSCVSEYDRCTSPGNEDYVNSCPPGAPYRCSHGLCVSDSTKCVKLNDNVCTKPGFPVLCATGECRESSELCPLVKPCRMGQFRCGDSSCRPIESECPQTSTCPEGLQRCDNNDKTDQSTFVLDGICAPENQCPSQANGCPMGSDNKAMPRCPNGQCVDDLSQCETVREANGCLGGQTKCWDGSCASDKLLCTLPNGCPADKPLRCRLLGKCVANNSECVAPTPTEPCAEPKFKCANGACVDDESQCTTPEGCPAYAPIRCANGDCVDKTTKCSTPFGCPVDKPVRCANGECRKYPATYRAERFGLPADQLDALTCPPVVSCPNDRYRLCANGDCVLSWDECPSVASPCAAGQHQCLTTNRCVSQESDCSWEYRTPEGTPTDDPTQAEVDEDDVPIKYPVQQLCPSSSPLMCPNGACVSSMVNCNYDTDPETTTIIGNPNSSQPDPQNPHQVLCFDGTYRDTPQACIDWSKELEEELAKDDGEGGSDGGEDPQPIVTPCISYCGNGQCIREGGNATQNCPIVKRCAAGNKRCADGTCRQTCDEIEPQSCPTGQELCQDGICRTVNECPRFDGCPYYSNLSYHCANRECTENVEGCEAAARRDGDAYAQQLIQDGVIRKSFVDANTTPNNNNITPQAIARKVSPNSIIRTMTSQRFAPLQADNDNATPAPAVCTASSCHALQKIIPTSFTYNPSQEKQDYVLSTASTAFTLGVFSGLQVDQNKDISIYVMNVAESEYYNATNKLTYSRIGDFGTTALTSAQTVLSPVFSCAVGAGINEPLDVPFTVTSSIDRVARPRPTDVCLARLRRFPDSNYAVWECLYDEEQRIQGGQYSVRPTTDIPISTATSVVPTCVDSDLSTYAVDADTGKVTVVNSVPAVYSFIASPVASDQVYRQSLDTFWRDNIVYILLGICGALLVIGGIIYILHRCSRYKGKSDKIQDEIVEMEEVVDEMENFGGKAGAKDEAVLTTANPLSQALADQNELRTQTDPEEQERRRKELEQQQLQSAERQEVITELEQDTERALAHLEAMKRKMR